MDGQPYIFFDLDGTLVDSVADIAHAVNVFLGQQELGLVTVDDVRGMMGDGAPELMERVMELLGNPVSRPEAEEMGELFLAVYRLEQPDRSIPYDGVFDALDALADAGYRFAVCTNKEDAIAEKVLVATGLASKIHHVIGVSRAGVHKPDPRFIDKAFQVTRSGTNVVMVGDSVNDIKMAKARSLPTVGCQYGYPREPNELDIADRCIDRISKLPEAVATLGTAGGD